MVELRFWSSCYLTYDITLEMFMIDFSQWKEYDGASEGSGRSEKVWLINPENNQVGLFKFKKDENTTDHISECIAYQLACLLDIECAKFELGTYNGREGSMSYRITNDNQSLVEGISFIVFKYSQYDKDLLKDRASGKVYSLEMIKESIQYFLDFKDFLVIPLFDYLIGNTDRHQNNWAAIFENEDMHFSPLYDNSSSLCAYMSEKDLTACLGNDRMKWKSVVETKSRSIIRITSADVQKPTHLEVLEYIKENYYEETKEIASRMISRITEKNIDKILDQYSDSQLLPNKKKVIKKFLLSKVEKMQEVYFKKEEQYGD